jgi:hypothetical protein
VPQQSQLYIVASRHPRVGKTLLARLLIEFLRISGRPLVGYDLDPREPALAGCLPSSPKYETIRIPRLSPIVRGVIDRPGFSFSTYMSQQPGGPTEVHSWVGQIFAEFRELELQVLIGELESSLRGGRKEPIRQIG